MDIFKTWAITLCVTLIFISMANLILPTSLMKSHVKFALSVILLAIMVFPIINILNLDKEIETFNFNNILDSNYYRENYNKDSMYSSEFITGNLEETLEKILRHRYLDKDFKVSIDGDINIENTEVNIRKVKVDVIDDKIIKKVDKIVIGSDKEVENDVQDDKFIVELKRFISEELKISIDKIKANYT